MPYLDPNKPHLLSQDMGRKFHQVVENKFKPHEVQEYLRTRLGNSAAVRQVGKDMQVMVNRWQSWAAAEIDTLRQQVAELEMELEMEPFNPDTTITINRKPWRNTKHDESDPY